MNLLTSAGPDLRYPGIMDSSFDIITIVNAICVAAYVAITLGFVALYYFGFSGAEVRGAATIVAILIAAFVAIDFCGKKLSNSD